MLSLPKHLAEGVRLIWETRRHVLTRDLPIYTVGPQEKNYAKHQNGPSYCLF